jgi:Cof subfamily protein (haloacid dehalogenase superfamily)
VNRKRRIVPHKARKIRCKLFATDLDGTVLFEKNGNSDSTLRTRRALQRLQAQGTTVALASGRMHESMVLISRHLGVKGPILSYNGAMLRLAGERGWRQPSLFLPLDAGLAKEVIDFSAARGVALNFYHGGKLYMQKSTIWTDLYLGRTSSPTVLVSSLEKMRGKRPAKLLMMDHPSRIVRLRDELAPRFAGRANVVITNKEYLEFMHPRVNKGSTLSELAGLLGVKRQDVVAAGDGFNDVEMLGWAGTSVSIRTAPPKVRRMAHHVVAAPSEDGLAAFIEERLLA